MDRFKMKTPSTTGSPIDKVEGEQIDQEKHKDDISVVNDAIEIE